MADNNGIPGIDPFSLAMQAAGAIYSIKQAKDNLALIKMGRDLEQAQFETNLVAARTEASEGSLEELKQLRSNVANQIAINAARGVSSAGGSAQASLQNSESIFASDEKARRLNLLMKENQLRAGNVLSGLHTLQSETKLGQSLTDQIFNRLPISGLAKTFGNSVNDALDTIGTSFGKKAGFGLNTIGG